MEEKSVRLLDSQFAGFLAGRASLSPKEKLAFQEIVQNLSAGMGGGDSCLPVSDVEQHLLEKSGLTGEESYPLRIWNKHLYLQRTFSHEKNLAESIKFLAVQLSRYTPDSDLLESLFGEAVEGETDWQREAAVRAVANRFLIISGGPGTGKTSTVVKVLLLLLSSIRSDLRIALAAPTGKAAMRLQESIGSAVAALYLPGDLQDAVPNGAGTIHRLLGARKFSPAFRHNRENPLPYDVVVLDEASMVDLALMAKLVDALSPQCRLILLGDKNQLASVESGAVLADLIAALPKNTVELKKSYRFDYGIKDFAEAINSGDSDRAWTILESAEPANVTRLIADPAQYGAERYLHFMKAVHAARTEEEYKELFLVLSSFKILCGLRKGKAGVSGINSGIEKVLTANGYDCTGSRWYAGRPVMATRNSYALNIFNGDVGICLPDLQNPELIRIWFERPDGTLFAILPGRLSSCETVYALTIHKSQGTEIGDVLVVLPENPSELISRELLYTAVTRAKKRVMVSASRSVFSAAVASRIERSSGLREMLLEEGGETGRKTTAPADNSGRSRGSRGGA